jgi:group I intron endonuclease
MEQPAIYQIRNIVNNKKYIGSSKNPKKRFREHLRRLRKNTHHSIILQNAWNKYGEDKFVFEIIVYCEQKDLMEKELLSFREESPEYNMSLSPTAPMTGRKHKPETIEKFKNRKYASGEAHYAYGKKQSLEHRRLLAERRTGTKRSEETKKKMSETNKRLNRYLTLLPCIEKKKKKIKDNLGNVFASLTECAIFHNISTQTVCDILKGRHFKTRKGVVFQYV